MPTIRIEMFSGRTLEQKRRLVHLVTDAVVEALGVEPKVVQIKIFEAEKYNFARAGVLRSDEEESSK
jgi:4-oxalocrotonate tautomerase